MPNPLFVVENVTINFQVYYLSLFEEFLRRAAVVVRAAVITWLAVAEMGRI